MNKKPLITSLLLLACSMAVFAAAPRRIWIDTDISQGKSNKDGGDAIALVMALQSDAIEIVGISLEGDVDNGTELTANLIKWFGRGKSISVFKGAQNANDNGKRTAAVEGLAAALRLHKMTIVALGPISNITNTILNYPQLKDSIESVVANMGRRPNMRFAPGSGKKAMSDYNFDTDPLAVGYLITQLVPVTFCGYEAASSVYLGKNDYVFLDEKNKEGGEMLYKEFRRWGLEWKVAFGSTKGFIPFDGVLMAYVLNPNMFEVEKNMPVDIQTMENDFRYGNFGEEKSFLLVAKDIDPHNSVNYCYKAKDECKGYILGVVRKATQ